MNKIEREKGHKHLDNLFAAAVKEKRLVCVVHVLEGFPSLSETQLVLTYLESYGADILIVVVPACNQSDSDKIQQAIDKALDCGASVATALDSIKRARTSGLRCGVVLASFLNPLIQFGLEAFCSKAVEVGVDGIMIMDLPFSEAQISNLSFKERSENNHVSFLDLCIKNDIAYIPLISSTTSTSVAQSIIKYQPPFVYVALLPKKLLPWESSLEKDLKFITELLKKCQTDPMAKLPHLAVDFNINESTQVDILSKIVDASAFVMASAIGSAIDKSGIIFNHSSTWIKPYSFICDLFKKRSLLKLIETTMLEFRTAAFRASNVESMPEKKMPEKDMSLQPIEFINYKLEPHSADSWYYGSFGGRFIPEPLMHEHELLSLEFSRAINDADFLSQINKLRKNYVGGPTPIHYAKRMTEWLNGAQLYFKREDLTYTGAHKINNALGQALIAKRMGKSRVIAETAAGQHGVACATACALLGLKCVIYMGAVDTERQNLNVLRMKLLGAEVVPVHSGSMMLKDAVNKALQDWLSDLESSYFLVGSAAGPHPFPKIAKFFQSVIGREARSQMLNEGPYDDSLGPGCLPNSVVACVGGGSNAIGAFSAFIEDEDVRLIGVQAGGTDKNLLYKAGNEAAQNSEEPYGSSFFSRSKKLNHSAPLVAGVIHGARTYVLQTATGDICDTKCISAGLDYPCAGPELAFLKESGRAQFYAVSDTEVLQAVEHCASKEGIIPALESAHAVAHAIKIAGNLPSSHIMLIIISGRGDKDMQTIENAIF